MCRIKFNIQSKREVLTANGRYRKVGATDWTEFAIDLMNIQTPNITDFGEYEMQVKINNGKWVGDIPKFFIGDDCSKNTDTGADGGTDTDNDNGGTDNGTGGNGNDGDNNGEGGTDNGGNGGDNGNGGTDNGGDGGELAKEKKKCRDCLDDVQLYIGNVEVVGSNKFRRLNFINKKGSLCFYDVTSTLKGDLGNVLAGHIAPKYEEVYFGKTDTLTLSNCYGTITKQIQIPTENVLPEDPINIDAGEDFTITIGADKETGEYVLSGTRDDDYAFEVKSIKWTQTEGDTQGVTIENADTFSPIVRGLKVGEYAFTLTVTYENGRVATDTVRGVVGKEALDILNKRVLNEDTVCVAECLFGGKQKCKMCLDNPNMELVFVDNSESSFMPFKNYRLRPHFNGIVGCEYTLTSQIGIVYTDNEGHQGVLYDVLSSPELEGQTDTVTLTNCYGSVTKQVPIREGGDFGVVDIDNETEYAVVVRNNRLEFDAQIGARESYPAKLELMEIWGCDGVEIISERGRGDGKINDGKIINSSGVNILRSVGDSIDLTLLNNGSVTVSEFVLRSFPKWTHKHKEGGESDDVAMSEMHKFNYKLKLTIEDNKDALRKTVLFIEGK